MPAVESGAILSAYPSSWSPDGKILLFQRLTEKEGSCCEIWTLRLDDKGKPEEPKKFLNEVVSAFSPDGRWVAYASSETGTLQVYVVPFPGAGGKWQISSDGGSEPRWSKKGHELFYVTTGTSMIEVPYSLEKNSFQPGKPQTLFRNAVELRAPFLSYDVEADGDHFVVLQFLGERMAATTEPTVVLNWLDQTRKVVAGQSNISN